MGLRTNIKQLKEAPVQATKIAIIALLISVTALVVVLSKGKAHG